jgi:CO/xanthine dehydrogenase Mo-binding subunit
MEAEYEKPKEIQWSDETCRGDAYGAYSWGCNIADVEIDPVTYTARCTDLVAAIDVGRAIHPLLVEGQIEGGTLQAAGWALLEEVVMQGGRMANGTLTNYIIPTTLDTPRLAVELVENGYAHGPFGAKGVGECPMDGPAAAIVNAINAATGLQVDAIPITPEKLFEKMTAAATATTTTTTTMATATAGG